MTTLQQWMVREKAMVARLRRMKRWQRPNRFRIVRGDQVAVTSGPDKGKTGMVTEVLRARGRLVVKGCNYRKRHKRAPGKKPMLVREESPIHISNVSLIDPVDGKPVKAALRYLEDGSKVRVSKRSGAVIPKNMDELLKRGERPVLNEVKDTPAAAAHKRTYFPPAAVAELIAAARAGQLRM